MKTRFNRPYTTGNELQYIEKAIIDGRLSGDGQFTQKCEEWLVNKIGCKRVLLAHSCTGALEMAALLAGIRPGDEIIMPSYTFVSTANAFVLRGAVPVFVDIRFDTLNIDEAQIEAAITDKTRAIVPVHYAGVGCEMNVIMDIASKYGLLVIEDAAQAIMSSYQGKPLGSFGHMSAYSFHETKNVVSGEGGALIINDSKFVEQAEIIREKGTNRSMFFRGQVDKYTWVDVGSSYLPGEIIAAFLLGQLDYAEEITRLRLEIWNTYYSAFSARMNNDKIVLPVVPPDCVHNAHMFYVLLPSIEVRDVVIARLNDAEIQAVFHYVPLHSSPAGMKFGRTSGQLRVTDELSGRLLRFPLWVGLTKDKILEIVSIVASVIDNT